MEVKTILCDGRHELYVCLNNMVKLGYNVKDSIIGITQDRSYYTICYVYNKTLGIPSQYEF